MIFFRPEGVWVLVNITSGCCSNTHLVELHSLSKSDVRVGSSTALCFEHARCVGAENHADAVNIEILHL